MTTNEVRRERFDIREEIAIIPIWASVLAAGIFVCVTFVFFTFVWGGNKGPGPVLPFKILMTLLPSPILAFLALMVGYVNRDAGRRSMNRTLWTVIVIFVPNAIGFILYFLLRNPIRVHCPRCAVVVDPRVNFCPGCGYSFHPTCPQCQTTIR